MGVSLLSLPYIDLGSKIVWLFDQVQEVLELLSEIPLRLLYYKDGILEEAVYFLFYEL